jgi:hypothetical protein
MSNLNMKNDRAVTNSEVGRAVAWFITLALFGLPIAFGLWRFVTAGPWW